MLDITIQDLVQVQIPQQFLLDCSLILLVDDEAHVASAGNPCTRRALRRMRHSMYCNSDTYSRKRE